MLLANVITSAIVAVSTPAPTNTAMQIFGDSYGYYIQDDSLQSGKRRVVVVNDSEYAILTGRLDKVWALYHKTTDSRKSIHGKLINTIVDNVNLFKHEVYADGYTHTEKMARITPKEKKNRLMNGIRRPPIRVKPNSMSARQWKKKIESESKTNKTVTVEFGPGGKVIREVK
jgi:hypothetical protein